MNYSVFRFTLNMHNHRSQASVAAFCGDTAVRLNITLTDGGNTYFIEDGCTAWLSGTKPDGSKLWHRCTILNNTTIQYDFIEQTTSLAGMVNCEIVLYGADGGEITAPKFTIVVDEREVYDTVITDTDTSILAGIALAEQARDDAEKARDEAEKKRDEADKVREKKLSDLKTNVEAHYSDPDAHKEAIESAVSAAVGGFVGTELLDGYLLKSNEEKVIYATNILGMQTKLPYSNSSTDQNTIVQRAAFGNILVPLSPASPNCATSKDYVQWYVDGKADALDSRVTALEDALIAFDQDDSTALCKSVPPTSGHTAYLNSIQGKAAPGTNKLNPQLFAQFGYTVNDDGTVTPNKTVTNQPDNNDRVTLTLPAGTYTLSSTLDWTIALWDFPNYNFAQGTITLNEPTTGQIVLEYGNGTYDYPIGIMLNEGSTALSFEPFQWMPTAVTEVKSYGANLLPYPLGFPASRVNEGITFTNNGDGTVSATGTSTAAVGGSSYVQWNTGLQLKAGVPYTATGVEGALTSPLTCRIRLIFQNGSPTQDVYGKTTFILNKDDSPNVLLIVSGGVTVKDYVFAPMITSVQGDVPYVPPLPRPFSTYQIPTEITSLPGYGLSMPDGSLPNELDFDAKTYTQRCEMSGNKIVALATPVVTSIAEYLPTTYLGITVQGGGELEFISETGESVPSTVTFLLTP